jgi:hypothetical protein
VGSAKECAEAQWALAALDAAVKDPKEREATVPHITPGKPQAAPPENGKK